MIRNTSHIDWGSPSFTGYVNGPNEYSTYNGPGPLTSSGTLTAVFAWNGPGSAPATFQAIVYAKAACSEQTATLSNGLGDSAALDASSHQYAAQGYHLKTISGASYALPLSVQNPGGIADADVAMTVYPITLSLTGTTPDSNGGLNVLTGGQVTATLNSPFPITSYSWSVSGATAPNPFLTWDPTFLNSNYPTQFVALTSTDTTKDSFSFYDAHNGDNITVQCTVTVQPPSGPALTVTAKSPSVTYIKPSVNWVTNQTYESRSFGFFDRLPNGPFGSQELWGPITITEPPLFVTPGNVNSVGLGVIVQIANLSRSNTRVPLNGKPATYSKISVLYANGVAGAIASPVGLDGDFPYPYGTDKNTDGTFTYVAGNYSWLAYSDGYSGDYPEQPYRNKDQDGGGDAWNASSASDSFDTWVMYRPASVGGQGTIYVPLQKLSWSWGGMASLDHDNLWSVSQSQPFISGPAANTDMYPVWDVKIPFGPNIGP